MKGLRKLSGKKARLALAALISSFLFGMILFGGCGGSNKDRKLTIAEVKVKATDLGKGWELSKEVWADPAIARPGSGIARLAGVGASKVLNQIFKQNEEKLQINLVQFDTAANAKKGVEVLKEEGGSMNIYGSKNNVAVEIIGESESAREKAAELFGINVPSIAAREGATGVEYKVNFDLATIDTVDYMSAQKISEYLQHYKEGQPIDPNINPASKVNICDYVKLFIKSGNKLAASYTCEPKPVGQEPQGDSIVFHFGSLNNLPQRTAVPYVTAKGRITVRSSDLENGDGTILDPDGKARCLEETVFWPTSNKVVGAVIKDLSLTSASDAGKIEAIWRWVHDNINYAGPIGTRYGTVQVIQQRYGRCWDFSDVFVTLCRAAKVPARQVAGWLTSGKSGHVWAQAYVEGLGWVSVDCTGDRPGTGTDYLPFFETTDGQMPIVYIKLPEVEKI